MIRKTINRRAYALILVLVFIALFLAMLGVTWRQIASVLRIEAVQSTQIRRDQGCLLAAIQGIHYLEKNNPTDSPSPFTYYFNKDENTPPNWSPPSATPIETDNPHYPCYKVDFTLNVTESNSKTWTVVANPYP